MADNFNLRAFLTENKLTKNAQILKEGSDYGYEALIDVVDTEYDGDPAILAAVEDAFHNGDIDTSDFGHDPSAPSNAVAQIANGMDIEAAQHNTERDFEEGVEQAIQESRLSAKERRLVEMVNEALNKDIKAFGQDLDKNFKAAGFDTLVIMQDPTAQQLNVINTTEKAALFQVSQNNEAQTLTLHVNPKQVGKAKSIVDKFQLSNYDGPVLAKGWTAKQVQGAINPGDIVKQDLNASRGIWYFYRLAKVDTKVVDVNESRLSAKERRLVEMVQRALGEEHQNADPNVPNDSTDMAIGMMKNGLPEGDEMAEKQPLPKYNSIEELMKEIDHGTNKAGHEYKMNRMKEVAEMLEAKVGSLEEGEHAEHIDQKAVKQMRKDILALRKAEEKLRKEFDKKFNKKDKPAAAPKAEAEKPTLQEGTFDLRKFLAENRK